VASPFQKSTRFLLARTTQKKTFAQGKSDYLAGTLPGRSEKT